MTRPDPPALISNVDHSPETGKLEFKDLEVRGGTISWKFWRFEPGRRAEGGRGDILLVDKRKLIYRTADPGGQGDERPTRS